MRKLTKKALSLVLCVMLVVSAISCAFSVTATTVGSTTLANGWKVYDAPYDLNGTEGMSTWLGNTSSAGNPLYVSENGVIKAGSGVLDMANPWEEAGPARFKIPGAVKGTKVKISFNFTVVTEGLTQDIVDRINSGERLQGPIIKQYNAAGTNIDSETLVLNVNTQGLVVTKEFTITDPNEFFRIILRCGKSIKDTWEISNITVTVTNPDTGSDDEEGGEVTPPADEEDVEASIIIGNGTDGATGTIKGFTASDVNTGLANADFSEGFKDWAIFRRWNTVADTALGLTGIASVENGVVTIKGRSYMDDGTTAFTSEGLGLASQAFTIPGLQAGDKLIMTLDAATSSKIRGALGEYKTTANNGAYSLTKEVFSNPNSANINIPYELWVTPELTVTDPNAYFVVTIRNKDVTKDVSFKNVRIYKVTAENNLIDVTAGCTPDSQPMNANGGTVEDGMIVARNSSNTYYSTDVVTTGLMNGDFSNGLKYWRLGKARRGYASYVASVVDGALNLVAYNSGNNENTTLRTSKMNLDAYAGKTISFSAETSKAGLGFYALVYEDGTQIAKKSIWAAGTIVVPDITIKEGSLYELEFRIEAQINGSQNGKVSVIDNVTIIAPEEEKVAQVGDDKYPTLEEAIAAANGGTVVLLKDIALADSLVIEAGTNIVLDLNGKTISRDTDAATSTAAIVNNGTLTIKDSVGGGKITAYAANPDTAEIPYYASNTITNCGVLTIKGGTIENSTGDEARAAFPIDNNSTSRDAILNIEGGTISGRGAIRQFANSTTKKNEVNITGGTVSGTSYAIWMQNPGSGDPLAALNISGGTVAKILLSPSANFEPAITGGTISEVAIWDASGDANRDPSGFVSGGSFNTAVDEAFRAEGYVLVDNGNGTYGVEFDPSYGKVAMIGDAYYATLEEAIAAANAGDTVKLLSDIDLGTDTVTIKGKEITIDLNGYNITGSGYRVLTVDLNRVDNADVLGKLTITGEGTVENTGTATGNSYAVYVGGSSELVVEGNATLKSTNGYSVALFPMGAGRVSTLTVNGGTITGRYAVSGNGTLTDTSTVITVNGGSIIGTEVGIYQPQPGTVTVNGGTIKGAEAALCLRRGSATVAGGAIEGLVDVLGDYAASTLNITGGDFTNATLKYAAGNTVTKAESVTLAAPVGYKWTNGTLSPVEYVAQVGDDKYPTLEEAIAAANGGTVVLITNVVLDAPLTIAKDTVVTIDLNGKKITYTSTTQAEAMISNKGTLTINDTVGGGEIYYDYVGAADPSYGKGNYTIDNAGTLTLNGGKINIATLRQHAKYPINNNSTTGDAIFVMNGGALYNYNTSAIRQFCNSTVYQNSVTINGGLVEGYSAIWVQNPGKNTVNATLTINGGEIRTTAAAYVNGTSELKDVSSKIYFTIDGEGGAWSETSAVVITGGTFNENVYLVEEAPANLTVDETAPTYNGRVELPVPPVVEEYDLETELYWVKGFKPAGSEDTRYGFLMTIGIDSLDYKKDGCGFYLTVGDTTKKFIIVNGTVWESLSVDLPEGTKHLAPVDFGEGNNYIMHYTVYFTEAELAALGSMNVSVKGFVTTFEGEELVTRTFNCGTLA